MHTSPTMAAELPRTTLCGSVQLYPAAFDWADDVIYTKMARERYSELRRTDPSTFRYVDMLTAVGLGYMSDLATDGACESRDDAGGIYAPAEIYVRVNGRNYVFAASIADTKWYAQLRWDVQRECSVRGARLFTCSGDELNGLKWRDLVVVPRYTITVRASDIACDDPHAYRAVSTPAPVPKAPVDGDDARYTQLRTTLAVVIARTLADRSVTSRTAVAYLAQRRNLYPAVVETLRMLASAQISAAAGSRRAGGADEYARVQFGGAYGDAPFLAAPATSVANDLATALAFHMPRAAAFEAARSDPDAPLSAVCIGNVLETVRGKLAHVLGFGQGRAVGARAPKRREPAGSHFSMRGSARGSDSSDDDASDGDDASPAWYARDASDDRDEDDDSRARRGDTQTFQGAASAMQRSTERRERLAHVAPAESGRRWRGRGSGCGGDGDCDDSGEADFGDSLSGEGEDEIGISLKSVAKLVRRRDKSKVKPMSLNAITVAMKSRVKSKSILKSLLELSAPDNKENLRALWMLTLIARTKNFETTDMFKAVSEQSGEWLMLAPTDIAFREARTGAGMPFVNYLSEEPSRGTAFVEQSLVRASVLKSAPWDKPVTVVALSRDKHDFTVNTSKFGVSDPAIPVADVTFSVDGTLAQYVPPSKRMGYDHPPSEIGSETKVLTTVVMPPQMIKLLTDAKAGGSADKTRSESPIAAEAFGIGTEFEPMLERVASALRADADTEAGAEDEEIGGRFTGVRKELRGAGRTLKTTAGRTLKTTKRAAVVIGSQALGRKIPMTAREAELLITAALPTIIVNGVVRPGTVVPGSALGQLLARSKARPASTSTGWMLTFVVQGALATKGMPLIAELNAPPPLKATAPSTRTAPGVRAPSTPGSWTLIAPTDDALKAASTVHPTQGNRIQFLDWMHRDTDTKVRMRMANFVHRCMFLADDLIAAGTQYWVDGKYDVLGQPRDVLNYLGEQHTVNATLRQQGHGVNVLNVLTLGGIASESTINSGSLVVVSQLSSTLSQRFANSVGTVGASKVTVDILKSDAVRPQSNVKIASSIGDVDDVSRSAAELVSAVYDTHDVAPFMTMFDASQPRLRPNAHYVVLAQKTDGGEADQAFGAVASELAAIGAANDAERAITLRQELAAPYTERYVTRAPSSSLSKPSGSVSEDGEQPGVWHMCTVGACNLTIDASHAATQPSVTIEGSGHTSHALIGSVFSHPSKTNVTVVAIERA